MGNNIVLVGVGVYGVVGLTSSKDFDLNAGILL
jgi:hypothetical protein